MSTEKEGKELLYMRIARQIREDIEAGTLPGGTRLMGVREMSDFFEASYKTIARALLSLEEEGYIRRIQGRGIFVEEQARWTGEGSGSETLGLLATELGRGPLAEVTRILEKRLSELGYQLEIRWTGTGGADSCRILEELAERKAKGILLLSEGGHSPVPQECLTRLGLPLLAIGWNNPPGTEAGASLAADLYEGFFTAAAMLYKKGHRRMAYLGVRSLRDDPAYRGCADFLRIHGDAEDSLLFCPLEALTHQASFRAMKELLSRGDNPTAVLCASDAVAAGVMRACREDNLAVPDDVSVIGCGDEELAALLEPPLTTLRPPVEALGMLAANTMDDIIQSRVSGETPLNLKVSMELIERKSVRENLTDEGSRWL